MFTIASYRFLLPPAQAQVLITRRNVVMLCKLHQFGKRKTQLVQSSITFHQSHFNTSSLGEKVKDAGQTLFYSGIVIAWGGGLFATGAFLFALVSELFSSQSPNSLYSDALKKCKEFPRICHLLGKPIVGFRGSHDDTRRILRHHTFFRNNVEHIHIRFYIKGIHNQATVCVVMKKKNGKFEYLYIVAETKNHPKEKIFVLDNRIPQEPSFQDLMYSFLVNGRKNR